MNREMDTPKAPIWAQTSQETTRPTSQMPTAAGAGQPPHLSAVGLGPERGAGEAKESNSPSVLAKIAIAVFALLLALGIFFGVRFIADPASEIGVESWGTSISLDQINDPSNTESAAEAGNAPTDLAQSTTTPGVGGYDPGAEPVAEAAAAVAPAVVLIETVDGQGSGIIYQEGRIVTNAHVLGGVEEVTIQLASGMKLKGSVIGADSRTDVAVVSFATDYDYGIAQFASDDSVRVGQIAVAIGSPFGLEQTVTAGVVSAVDRVVNNISPEGKRTVVAMLQTDAPINPGNSGGALVDRQGRVVGMNTSIRTDGSGGNIGVGFAVPSDTVLLIASRIENGESLEYGFLGIQTRNTDLGEPGVVIESVIEGGGAEAAGILPEDLLISFDGQAIRNYQELVAAVWLQPPGTEIEVEVRRGGEVLSFDVVLSEILQD